MSSSDRLRSPTLRRSGSALSHADLPGFPRWRGPWAYGISCPGLTANVQSSVKSPVARLLESIEVGTLSVRPMLHATMPQSHPFPHVSTNSTYVPSTHLSTVMANPTKHPGISAVSTVTLQSNSAMSTNSASQHQPLPHSNGISSRLSSRLSQHTPVVN